MSALPFATVYFVPLLLVAGARLGGAGMWVTPIFVFVVVPLLDPLLGKNRVNPDPAQEQKLAGRKSFALLTWLAVPVELGLLVWGAWLVTHRPLTLAELAGFTLSVGISGGALGITVAHELIHRQDRLERVLGSVLLWSVGYLHWAIEHVRGHHRLVATPLDPATGRLGQSYYRFWPQTVGGTLRSAWRLEARRLRMLGRRVRGPHNRMLRYLAAELALAAGLTAAFGLGALLLYLARSFVAFSLLEVINYVEHYGLERQPLGKGRWAPFTARHAWNASERLTNWFLFNLQRHPDHHLRPQRRYQLLHQLEQSPQLPTGYAGMVLLALVPPLWRKVMDPRAQAARGSVQ